MSDILFSTNFNASSVLSFPNPLTLGILDLFGSPNNLQQFGVNTSSSSSQTILIGDVNFSLSSPTSTESILYLGGSSSSISSSSNLINSSPITPNSFSVGNMITDLTIAGSDLSDSLYLKAYDNNTLSISSDGNNFIGLSGFDFLNNKNITISLGAGNDSLHVDSSVYEALQNYNSKISFDGGSGNNTIFGSSIDTTWNISGANSGNLGKIDFQNVGDLKGAADNQDEFVFSPLGTLSGVADGGTGGFDTLVIDGGNYATANYTATSPHDGAIAFDAKVITYAGLEPIIDNAVVADRVFNATIIDDDIVVQADGIGRTIIFSSNTTFESISFLNPSSSLTINALDGKDTVTVNALGSDFNANLTIDGGANIIASQLLDNSFIDANIFAGDTVTFASDLTLAGKNLKVTAERINVNSGVVISVQNLSGDAGSVEFTGETIKLLTNSKILAEKTGAFKDGNVTLTANDTQKRLGVEPFGFNKKDVSITLESGTVVKGGDVTITSTAADITLIDEVPAYAKDLLVKPFAQLVPQLFNAIIPASIMYRAAASSITVTDATITGSGKVNITATTKVDSSVQAVSTINSLNPISRAAIAYGQAESSAQALIQGTTSISGSKGVTVLSDVTTTNNVSARVFGNIGFLGTPVNSKDAGFSIAVANSNTTSLAIVDSGVTITSTGGNIKVNAKGKITNSAKATTNIFVNGTAGIGVGLNFDRGDIRSEVNGTLTAAGALSTGKEVDLSQVSGTNDTIQINANGFETGELVKYIANGGTPISGLTDKQSYYVIAQDGDTFRLSKATGLELDNSGVSATSVQSFSLRDSKEFDAQTKVDYNTNQINIANHSFVTGQRVSYNSLLGDALQTRITNPDSSTADEPLTNDLDYYIIKISDSNFQLAETEAKALAGTAIDLLATPTSTLNSIVFTKPPKTFNPSGSTVKDSIFTFANHGFVTGDAVVYNVDGSVSTSQNMVTNNTFNPVTGVNVSTDTIAISEHGLTTGDKLTYLTDYLGAPGTAVGSLTKGVSYYAIVVDKDTIKLADSLVNANGGNAIDLTSAGTGEIQSLRSVKQVTAGDTAIGGLADGDTYFVSVIDANHFRLADSEVGATDAAPIDIDPATATQPTDPTKKQNFAKKVDEGNGIIINATLDAKDKAIVSGKTGSNPKIKDIIANGDVAQGAFKIFDFVDYKKNLQAIPGGSKDNSFSIGAGLGLNYVDHSGITAKVGSTAKLKSGADVDIAAKVTQETQLIVDSSTGKDEAGGSVSISVGVAIYKNIVNASIESNAEVDSKGTINVTSKLDYPFLFIPSKKFNFNSNDPDPAVRKKATDDSAGNVVALAKDLLLDGKLGIPDRIMNTFVTSRNKGKVDPAKGGIQPTVGVAFALAVNTYNNESNAVIKSGAKINQDPAYQTSDQSVNVEASTAMTLLAATGIISFDINIDGIVKGVKKKDSSEVFSFSGNKAKTGFGGSALVSVMNNSTNAKIEDGAKIHTGDLGGLRVNAKTDVFTLMLAQSGGDAEKLGVSGSISVLNQTNRTIAQIGSGVEIKGGKVDVEANDANTQVTLVGAVQTAESTGVGVSIGVFNVSRDTQAFIGNEITDTSSAASTKNTKITAAGDVTVKANNSGGVGTLTIAGAVVSNTLLNGVNSKQAEVTSILDGLGGKARPLTQANDKQLTDNQKLSKDLTGAATKATEASEGAGLAIAGNISVNVIQTKTKAYINDNATINISKGKLDVESEDSDIVVTVAGALAVSNKPNASSSTAIAGALSVNVVSNETKAFVKGGAIVVADELSIAATQKGFIASITGALGAAKAAGGGGAGFAGSISANVILTETEAYASGSTFTLANGASITAKDLGQIWSVAGAVGYGGKGGVGVSGAANIIGTPDNQATAKAYIENSTLTVGKGTVSLSATSDAFLAGSPKIIAITGSAGIGGGENPDSLGIAGMVGVNIISADTSASIANSTIIDSKGDANPTNVNLTATDNSWIIAIGGAVGVGQKAGVGAAIAYNEIRNKAQTYIEGSTLNIDGALSQTATSTSQIQSVTLGVGVSAGASGLAAAGSLSINVIKNTVDAHISKSSNITTGGAIALKAKDSSLMVSITGGVAVSVGSNATAVGASISYNLIQNTVTSYVDNSIIRDVGSMELTATDSATLVAVSVGAAGSTDTAIGGSVTVNSIANNVDAHISGGSDVLIGGDLTITAAESSNLYAISGGLALSTGGAAVGAAIAYNYVGGSFDVANPNLIDRNSTTKNQINAYIDNSKVNVGNNLSILSGFQAPTNPLADKPNLTQTEKTFNTATLVNLTTDTIDFGAPHGFVTGQAIVYRGNGLTDIGGLTEGNVYYAVKVDDNKIKLATTSDYAIKIGNGDTVPSDAIVDLNSFTDISADTIDFGTAHGLNTGDKYSYSDNNGGNTEYFVIKVDNNKIKLATSQDYAIKIAASQTVPSDALVDLKSSGTATSNKFVSQKVDVGAAVIALPLDFSSQITTVTVGGAGGDKFALGGAVSLNFLKNTVDTRITNIGATQSVTAGGKLSLLSNDTSQSNSGTGGIGISLSSGAIGAAISYNEISNSLNSRIGSKTGTITDGNAGKISAAQIDLNSTSTAKIINVTLAGAGASSFALGPAVSINRLSNTIDAHIANSNNVVMSSGSSKKITIAATDSSTINATAFGGALVLSGSEPSGTAIAIGVAVARNELNNTNAAYIDSSTISSSDTANVDLQLQATTTNKISAQAIAAAVAIAKAQNSNVAVSGGGAGVGNYIISKTNAYINSSTLTSSIGNLDIKSTNNSTVEATVLAISGSVAIGGTKGTAAAIGAAVAINNIGYTESGDRTPSEVQAYIQNSSITANGDLTLSATSTQSITSRVGAGAIAIAASSGTNLSGAGSGVNTTNNIAALVKAFIDGNSSKTIQAKSVSLSANDTSSIEANAGAASIAASIGQGGGKAASLAIGVAIARNLIYNEIEAAIKNVNSLKTTTNGVSLAATTSGSLKSVSVAASIAVTVDPSSLAVSLSGAGAESKNVILTKTNAYVSNSVINSAGAVSLDAKNISSIDATVAVLAAAVNVGSKGAGLSIGAAFADNNIGYNGTTKQPAEIQAYILNSTITATGALSLSAVSTQTINAGVGAGSVAVAAAGSGTSLSVAGAGAVTQDRVSTLIKAYIEGNGAVQVASATLKAEDNSVIKVDAGAAAVAAAIGDRSAFKFAMGVAIANTLIDNDVTATIGNNNQTFTTTTGGVDLSASSNSSIKAVSVAASLSVGITKDEIEVAGNSGSASSTNTILGLTNASLVGVNITSAGAVNLSAKYISPISATASSTALNTIANNVNAYISNSNVTSIGAVALDARNTSTIDATVLAFGFDVDLVIGGKTPKLPPFATPLAFATNLIGYNIAKPIDLSTIGSYIDTLTESIKSIFIGDKFNRAPNNITAYIEKSSLSTNGTLSLTAIADETVNAVVGSASVVVGVTNASGGLPSVALSVSGVVADNKIANLVKAYIDGDGVTGIQATQATLKAEDTSTIKVDAGAASVAGVVATGGVSAASISIGVAIADNLISNEVEAAIKNADTSFKTTSGGIELSANTKGSITATAVAASLAVTVDTSKPGFALSGGGASSTNTILSKTNARITGSKIDSAGAVSLSANNESAISATVAAVSASVGVSGKAGVGVSIGAAIAKNSIGYEDGTRKPAEVQAYIQNSNVVANGGLTLSAIAKQTINAVVGAGSMAVAASSQTGIAGSGSGVNTENKVATLIKAFIDGDSTTTIQVNSASLTASDQSSITADAGAASIAASFAGTTGVSLSIGVALANNLISNDVAASINGIGDFKTTTGDIALNASTNSPIKVLAVAASLAAGAAGTTGVGISGAGAAAINTILTKTNAFISGSKIASAGAVTLSATSTSKIDATIAAVSLAVGAGGTTGVGVSIGAAVAINNIGYQENGDPSPAEVQAYIKDSSLTANGALTLSAIADEKINAGVGAGSAAVSGGGTAGVAASGTGVYTENKIATLIKAYVDGDGVGTSGIKATSASFTAKDTSIINADAGAAAISFAFGGTAGVSLSIGVAVAKNLISNEIEAGIKNANDSFATTTGGVVISAEDDSTISTVAVAASLAVGAGGTAGVAISGAGAAAINTIFTKTNAVILDSKVTSAGAISLDAKNTAKIDATIAAVSAALGGGGTAGVGVAIGAGVAINNIGYKENGDRSPAEVQARIERSSLTANGALTLNAVNDATINANVFSGAAAVALGGTAGVGASGSGVSTENKIATLVKSFVDGDGATGIKAASASIKANDKSTIMANAGAASLSIAGSGTASVAGSIGVSLAHNLVTNEVEASVQNADNFFQTTAGIIDISATTDKAKITASSSAASLAAGISGTAGVGISGAGAESTNTINTKTNAFIKNSNAIGAGETKLTAFNDAEINATVVAAAVALGVSGTAGAAAAIGVSVARNQIGWEVDSANQTFNYTTNDGGLSNPSDPNSARIKKTLNKGDRVKVASGVRAGDIYEFIGDNGTAIDLTTADYGSTDRWRQSNLKLAASEVLAYIDNSSVSAGGALTLTATSKETINALVLAASVSVAGGIGGGSLSGAGSGTENKIGTKVKSYIDGDGSNGISASSIGLSATDTSIISASVEAVSLSVTIAIGGSVSISGAVAVNDIANDIGAYIQNANNKVKATTGDILLSAKEDSTINSASIAAAFSVAIVGLAAAGALSTNKISNTAKSYIGSSIVEAQGSIGLTSSDKSIINAIAGNISGGTAGAIGISLAINNISNNTISEIANSTVTAITGAIGIGATSNNAIKSLAVGAGISGGVTISGASTNNFIRNNTSAITTGTSSLTSAGAVTLSAIADPSSIESLAGQIAGGIGVGAIGAAISTNDIASKTIADLGGTAVKAASLTIEAKSISTITAIAAGAAGGGTFAVNGAATLNKIANETKAGSSSGSSIDSTGAITVTAKEIATIKSLAGQVSGGGAGSIGGSVATNEITSSTIAELNNTRVTKASQIDLTATSEGSIDSIAAGAAAAGGIAAGGAVTLNTIGKTVKAAISNGSDVTSTGAITLTATDTSPIQSIAGQLALSGVAAVGIAVATNDISSKVSSEVNNSKAVSTANAIGLNATSSGSIKTIGIGGSVAAGGTAAGAVTLNKAGATTKAITTGASTLQAAGAVNLIATNTSTIESLAGQIGLAAGVSIGAAVATNEITSRTIAELGGTKVIASVINLNAKSTNTIGSIAAGASGGGAFAGGGAVTLNKIGGETRADIVSGSDVTASSAVSLTAWSNPTIKSLAGQVSGGGTASIGGAVSTNLITSNTIAEINNSKVVSGGSLKLKASLSGSDPNAVGVATSSTIDAIAAGAGASGGISAGGAVTTNEFSNQIQANIANGANVQAQGDIDAHAINNAAIQSLAGQLAISGAASIGAAVAVNNFGVKTKSSLGGTIAGSGKVKATAENMGTISSLSAGASLAIGGAVTGAVSVNNITNTTEANTDGANITSTGAVEILAKDTSAIDSLAGQVSGALGAAVGASAAYNNISNTVTAAAKTSTINTSDNLLINAFGKGTINTKAAGGSAGLIVGGAFSVAINQMSNNVSAFVDTSTVIAQGSIGVFADSKNTINTIGGSIGAGLVGLGATIAVNTLENSTTSYINNSSLTANVTGNQTLTDPTGNTTVKGIAVMATSQDIVTDTIGTAAGSLALSVAATIAVNNFSNTTKAYMYAATANSKQGVYIKALNDSQIDVKSGSVSVSILAGAGATIDVTSMKNVTAAYVDYSPVGSKSNVSADTDFVVDATTKKSVTSNLIAAGAGLGFGISGAISIINISSGMSSQGTDAAEDTQNLVNSRLASLNNQGGTNSQGNQNIATKDVSSSFSSALPTVKGTTAYIHGNFSANTITVNANESTNLDNLVGAYGVGLILGATGSVAIANIANDATAYIGADSTLTRADITVSSKASVGSSSTPAKVKTLAGAGGIVGIGAAISNLTATNNSTAYIDNRTSISFAGDVKVTADSDSNVEAEALGSTAGAVAIGIVQSNAKEDGTTKAYLSDGATIQNTKSLSVTANANAATNAIGQAANVLSLVGVVDTEPTATTNTKISAYIGKNNNISVLNDVSVRTVALLDGDSKSKQTGISAIAAVGASKAKVISNPIIDTYIDINTAIAATNVTLSANVGKAPVIADTSFNPNSSAVNYGTDTITFATTHGFNTGDRVIYSNGSPADTTASDMGNLTNNGTYKVIKVTDTTIKLGAEFTADSTTVNTALNTLTFAGGHGFTEADNGKQFRYEVTSGSVIGGLSSGALYYIKVIDANTLKLYSSPPPADDVLQAARLSNISGASRIDPDGSNIFNNGDKVTYQKRSALATVVSTLPSGVSADADSSNLSSDIASSDRIHSGTHGFENGDRVVYKAESGATKTIGGLVDGGTYVIRNRDANSFQLSTLGGANVDLGNAAASTSHRFTAVGLKTVSSNTSGFTYNPANAAADNNIIAFASAHGFTNDQAIEYRAGSTAVGGLTDGAIYYVKYLTATTLQLSSTQGGSAIDIAASADSQTLAAISGDLQEGVVYYVVNSTGSGGSDTFQIAATVGGSAIKLNKSQLTGTGLDHLFVKRDEIDLTTTGSGTQNLHFDLTTTGNGAKHSLTTGAIVISSPKAGDQVFSAYSEAFNGGLVGITATATSLDITPTLNTSVKQGAVITAKGNVLVESNSSVQVSSGTDGTAAGFIGFGESNTSGNVNNQNKTLISGATIKSDGNVTVNGLSQHNLNLTSEGAAGGLAGLSGASTNTTLKHDTTITIEGNANITATEHLLVHSDSDTNANISSRNQAYGFYADADATANLRIDGSTTSTVNQARLQGRKLTVESVVTNLNDRAYAYARGAGAIGNIDAHSTVDLTGTDAVTTLGNGAFLKADNLFLNAIFKNVNSNSSSHAHCDGLGGDTDADATNLMPLNARVLTDANSNLEVYTLDVKSDFETLNFTTSATHKLAWALRIWFFGWHTITLDFGSTSTNPNPASNTLNPINSNPSTIGFNSNVVLLGRNINPFLNIDVNGNVTKSANVTTSLSGNDIIVGDITNVGNPKVTFTMNDNRGTFVDNGKYTVSNDRAFDSVLIDNYSTKNLVINKISTIANIAVSNPITYNLGSIAKGGTTTINLNPASAAANPTLVAINNWSGSDLILNNLIDNPHDRTVLYSKGRIAKQGVAQQIITRDLSITADNGDIGASGQKINAKLTRGYATVSANVPTSVGGKTTDVGLAASAQGSLYLDLATQRLDANPVTVNVDKINASTGEVDLTIESTTDASNNAIASTYNFANPNAINVGLFASNNVKINAGTTSTTIKATIGTFGSGIFDVRSGDSINIDNFAGKVNIQNAISTAGSITFTTNRLDVISNGNVQAGQDIALNLVGDFNFASTATMTAGSGVVISNQGSTPTTSSFNGSIIAASVAILGNSSDDTINIQRVLSPTYVFTGSGNDIVNLGSNQPSGNGLLSQIQQTITLDADANYDTLNIDDSGNTAGTTGTVSNNQITGFGMAGIINYSNFENINLQLGSGGDNVTVNSTQSGTTISGNGGNDTFTVYSVSDPTVINGGSGTNQLLTDLPISSSGLTFLDPNNTPPTPLSGGGGFVPSLDLFGLNLIAGLNLFGNGGGSLFGGGI